MPLRLRLDPWAADYGSALQIDDEADDAVPDVDCAVELPCSDWRPLDPQPGPRPDPISFVDGVQRLEARVTVEERGETLFGAMASVAVGAVRVQASTATLVDPIEVRRTVALADSHQLFEADGSLDLDPIEIPCGSSALRFSPRLSTRPGRDDWRDVIDRLRRELELKVGQQLAEDDQQGLVVLDGRLRLRPAPSTAVVGYIKTLHRQYLAGDCRAVLPQLRAGQRSPLFAIHEEEPLYSWYLRLTDPRPIDHALAGIVRLETAAAITRDRAVELADKTTLHLPAFAAPPERDPRAPQNLLPIGGLETRLRHELGDATWVRRAIEQYLFQAVA